MAQDTLVALPTVCLDYAKIQIVFSYPMNKGYNRGKFEHEQSTLVGCNRPDARTHKAQQALALIYIRLVIRGVARFARAVFCSAQLDLDFL